MMIKAAVINGTGWIGTWLIKKYTRFVRTWRVH